ncbi:MAG: hypothetical protein R3C61_13600 [Bacteroidia bacterium]
MNTLFALIGAVLQVSVWGQTMYFSRETQTSPRVFAQTTKSGPDQKFILHPNYPHPLTGYLPIRYEIREPGHYVVSLAGSRGKEICRLVDSYHSTGEYRLNTAITPKAHGVYMYCVKDGVPTTQRRLYLFRY